MSRPPLTFSGRLAKAAKRIHWPAVAALIALIVGVYLLPAEKLQKIIDHDWTSTLGVLVALLGTAGLASSGSLVKPSAEDDE